MLTDYDLAVQCQKQYDGQIILQTVAGVVFSVVNNDDAVDLVFRGTSDLTDAKRDLEALMVECPLGRVHAGAWDGLQASIPTDLPHDRLIRLSGHSLGAMRAAMAACILYQKGFRNLECVTFGSPLWGDQAAVNCLTPIKNRTYQNYNNLFEHDLFTTIPVHLPEEPYVIPPNRIRGWSAPTATNEWKDEGVLIEAHSLSDCYIPLVQKLCAQS